MPILPLPWEAQFTLGDALQRSSLCRCLVIGSVFTLNPARVPVECSAAVPALALHVAPAHRGHS